jgi:hypothetical protein
MALSERSPMEIPKFSIQAGLPHQLIAWIVPVSGQPVVMDSCRQPAGLPLIERSLASTQVRPLGINFGEDCCEPAFGLLDILRPEAPFFELPAAKQRAEIVRYAPAKVVGAAFGVLLRTCHHQDHVYHRVYQPGEPKSLNLLKPLRNNALESALGAQERTRTSSGAAPRKELIF